MEKIVMESVVLTPAAVAAWQEMASRIAPALRQMNISLERIEDEEIFLKDDKKALLIRCKAGPLEVTMDVPEGQWSWSN